MTMKLKAAQVAADTVAVSAFGTGLLRVGKRRRFVFRQLQRAFTVDVDERVVEIAFKGETRTVTMKPPQRTTIDVAGAQVPPPPPAPVSAPQAHVDVPTIEFPNRVELWE